MGDFVPFEAGTVLGRRALNRALLVRQMLTDRQPLGVEAAIEHLVGMQGQAPLAPYVGLWSRVKGFRPEELAKLVEARQVVRMPLMRATVHMVTARDAVGLYPLVRPVLARGFAGSEFGKAVRGVDLDALAAAGREALEEKASTRVALGAALKERWPEVDATSLAYAITYLLPVVQVPPRGVWGRSGAPTWALAEGWLGRPFEAVDIEEVVRRYLGAFGPASVMDVQTFCGLTRLGEVLERLRPQLMVYRDEGGRELFDLPDAPRPDPEIPAPPRFLPEYDNLFFNYADRWRLMEPSDPLPLWPGNGAQAGTFLVDGFYAGTWKLVRDKDLATLAIEFFRPAGKRATAGLAKEGERLLKFIAKEAGRHEIQISTR